MEVAPFKLALVGATQSRVLFKKEENATHCEKWFLFSVSLPYYTLLGPGENNMSTGAGLARNLCSQTSQTFTLRICMFFPCAQWKLFLWWHIWPIPCVGCLLAVHIPQEIFCLKVITIARCGVVLREESFLNELISTFQTTVISESSHSTVSGLKMSKVRACRSYRSPLRRWEESVIVGSSEGSMMAVIVGVKSNITPGVLSNGWV